MKVYRGYDKQYDPITKHNWIYVTPDIEQAKWYAVKDGDIKNGAIMEYDMDKDNISLISLKKINSMAEDESERYTVKDLLWYQEDLAYSLNDYVNGIYFTDPYNVNHTIYILFDEKYLQNPRELSKEEFDAIKLNESINEQINEVLRLAGCNEDYDPKTGRFTKGGTPWNKGKYGYMGANKTSFTKDDVPPASIGMPKQGHSAMVTATDELIPVKSKNGKLYNHHKRISYPKWVLQQNGIEVPVGCVVWHKDGDYQNNSLDNLEVITRAESMNRTRELMNRRKQILGK